MLILVIICCRCESESELVALLSALAACRDDPPLPLHPAASSPPPPATPTTPPPLRAAPASDDARELAAGETPRPLSQAPVFRVWVRPEVRRGAVKSLPRLACRGGVSSRMTTLLPAESVAPDRTSVAANVGNGGDVGPCGGSANCCRRCCCCCGWTSATRARADAAATAAKAVRSAAELLRFCGRRVGISSSLVALVEEESVFVRVRGLMI